MKPSMKKRVRLLYLALLDISKEIGGTIHIREVVTNLSSFGIDTTLITPSSKRTAHSFARRYIRLSDNLRKRSKFFTSLFFIIGIVKLFFILLFEAPKHDIIYTRNHFALISALIPAWVFGKKIIYEVNGIPSEEIKSTDRGIISHLFVLGFRLVEKFAARKACHIIAVTEGIKQKLISRGIEEKKITVIRNGVNTSLFKPYSGKRILEFRKKYGFKETDRIITFVGNLAPWTNLEMVFDILPELLLRFHNLRFVIAGDGEKFKAYKSYAAVFPNNAFLLGHLPQKKVVEIVNISNVCLALVENRRMEAIGLSPLKLLEYLACRKPTIATRVKGYEFIEKEGVGYLVGFGDRERLKEKLISLLSQPNLCKEMGERGRKLAEKNSWKQVSERVSKVIQSCLCGYSS